MIGMERDIIWSGNVKPSSPTPQNVRMHKLSMLDQLSLASFIPIVFHFPINSGEICDRESFISQTSETLKGSLSSTLSRFYPVAGRVGEDGHSIDCNDEGVPFVVARFRGCNLNHVPAHDHSGLLERLLPSDLLSWYADYEKGGPASSVALVQANFFDCGGVAVAALLWHRVFDAAAISSFIRSWAAAARGSSVDPACPNFISQSLFPLKQELVTQSRSAFASFKKGNAVIRRLVFSAAAVSKLKAECGGGTRVEAVSALIWKCFMAASLAYNNSNSVLIQAVNLRRRARPPFSSECFGNWIGIAAAASSNESAAELGFLASKIRDSIRIVDGEYVDRLRGDNGLSGYRENQKRAFSVVPAGGGDFLYMTSWCGLGFYSSIDFGWGTPAQITRALDWKSPFVNFVSLNDTSGDEGVEACVVLDDKYMEVFEQQELKTLAQH